MAGRIAVWKGCNRIDELKRVARTNYETYRRLTEHLDCGQALAEEISGPILSCKLRFNQAMEELEKIDPACPVMRL